MNIPVQFEFHLDNAAQEASFTVRLLNTIPGWSLASPVKMTQSRCVIEM